VNEPWWISLIKSAVIVNLVMVAFAYTTWLERKLLGRMQNRYGPNRAGPYGLLQPFADLIKLVRKESFFPSRRGPSLHQRPIIAMFTALAAFAVIPFGQAGRSALHVDGVIANVSIGLILLFALGSVGVYGAIVGGWAPRRSTRCSARCARARSSSRTRSRSRSRVLGVVLMGQSLTSSTSSTSSRRRSGSSSRRSSACSSS
jgi:NADH-quinone oxidoreductase subunit H